MNTLYDLSQGKFYVFPKSMYVKMKPLTEDFAISQFTQIKIVSIKDIGLIYVH